MARVRQEVKFFVLQNKFQAQNLPQTSLANLYLDNRITSEVIKQLFKEVAVILFVLCCVTTNTPKTGDCLTKH